MALGTLGKVAVTASGTPERATKNLTTPSARLSVQGFMVQALPGNAGLIYVGDSTMVIATGVGVMAVLPKPTAATTGPFPSVSFAVVEAPAGINLNDVYIDTSSSGDAAYISYTIQ